MSDEMAGGVAVPDGVVLGRRLTDEVLAPMKSAFVAKDEIIDLLGVCLVAGENLFILGPPGTAKTALVQDLARRIDGRMFDYLLTRFTEPNELFGPFDIRKLREGELVTNTEGMLPEASLVFLDELLNANSAILNSLLLVLNERVFRRGRETRALPLLMVVGASNRLPEDDALGALFDRFLLRVRCDNVAPERMQDVLVAGWELDLGRTATPATFPIEGVRCLNALLGQVNLDPARPAYIELIHRLRYAGIPVSDRRAVKLQRLMAASALLCGRLELNPTDLWVLRYIWDAEEQQEVLSSIVKNAIDKSGAAKQSDAHPRSRGGDAPDADSLARDLRHIADRLAQGALPATERSYLKDRLGLLAARCPWVEDSQQRAFLEQQVSSLWKQLEAAA
jgi:MoxR-like ATPase